jgi:sugar phosphate isomerase/epimerase
MIPSFSASGVGLVLPELDFGLRSIARAGFRAVDLRIRDLFESGIDPLEIRRRLDDHGLVPGTCQFPLDWRGGNLDFEPVLTALPNYVEFAAVIGVRNFYTRVSECVPENEIAEDIIETHRIRLAAIAKLLEARQIGLALEAVGVASFRKGRPPLMASHGAIRSMLADLFDDCPNLGLLFDAFHLHAAGETVDEAVGPFGGRILGIHIADLPHRGTQRHEIIDHERALPGTTDEIPVARILSELRSTGCPIDTPVIVESIRCPAELAQAPFDVITRAVYDSLIAAIGMPADRN